jgi:hypothetical protein
MPSNKSTEETLMITFIRTANAMPGKLGDVFAAAKEIGAAWKRVNGSDLSIGSAFGGEASEVAWIVQLGGVSDLDTGLNRLLADSEYRAVLKKMETLLIPGSIRDQIWRHI